MQSLIESHANLVIASAKHIAKRHWEDYVAAGFDGLVQAAGRYRPDRGASFATFARKRIIGAIKDQMRYQTTRLPYKSGRGVKFVQFTDGVSYDRPNRLDLPATGLTREERMALTMRFEDGATYPMIAQAIGVSDSNVYFTLNTALAKCRTSIAASEGVCSRA